VRRSELETDCTRVVTTDDVHLFTEGNQQVCNLFPRHHLKVTKMPWEHEAAQHTLVKNRLIASMEALGRREEVSSLVEAGGTVFDAPISTETQFSVAPS
jgi:hypothetical protein